MISRIFFICLFAFAVIAVAVILNFPDEVTRTEAKSESNQHSIEESSDVVDYKSVASLKLASRKTDYRIGELISIDLALFNKSQKSVSFLELGRWVRLSAFDVINKEVDIGKYNCPLYAPKFNSIDGGQYESAHLLYLIGCEGEDIKKKFKEAYVSMEDDFNKNNFVSLGGGCIEIEKPGKYSIKASISNTFTTDDKTNSTAVGEIESNTFEINIVD